MRERDAPFKLWGIILDNTILLGGGSNGGDVTEGGDVNFWESIKKVGKSERQRKNSRQATHQRVEIERDKFSKLKCGGTLLFKFK